MPTLDLKKLGNKGDKEACAELAHRYQDGIGGVFKDELEAKKSYKKQEVLFIRLPRKQAKKNMIIDKRAKKL